MKKNILITLLFIGMVFPFEAKALTGNIELECDSTTVLTSSNITCKIKGNNFSEEISSFHAELLLGDNLILESIDKDSTWEGSAEGGIIDLYTDVNKSGDVNFATFTIKADTVTSSTDTNISIDSIRIGNSQFNEYDFEDLSTLIKITSQDNENENENEDEPEPGSGTENEDEKENEPSTDNNPVPDVDNNQNNTDNNVATNPKTGNSINIFLLISIILFSISILIIMYKKNLTFKEN